MRLLFLAFSSALLSISSVMAHDFDNERNKADFKEIKKLRLEQVDKLRKCISNSKDFGQIKECKPRNGKMYKRNKDSKKD